MSHNEIPGGPHGLALEDLDPDLDMVGLIRSRLPAPHPMRHIALAAVTGAIVVACGAYFGGLAGALLAFCFGVMVVVGPWWFADGLVIRACGARSVDTRLNSLQQAMLTDLSLRAGVPTPRCYVVPNPQPNAFAIGRTPRRAAIVVTEGFLSLLEPAEIRAVFAHEIIHIRHRDTRTTAIAGAAFSQLFAAVTLPARHRSLGGTDRMKHPQVVPLRGMPRVIGLVWHTGGCHRESEADRCASDLCGDPEALARALARIDRYAQVVPMDIALAHVAHWVVNPLGDQDREVWLFATPPLRVRIDTLLEVAHEPMAL